MKFYKDKELKEEIIDSFDGGEVEIGTTEEYTIYIHNNSGGLSQNIIFTIEPDKEKYSEEEREIVKEECEIIEKPESLNIDEKSELKLSYSPSIELKKSLKVKIKVEEKIIYP
jgi:hypothetical protein